jgi:hypothetical protein
MGLEFGTHDNITDSAKYAWIQPRFVGAAVYTNLALMPKGGNVGVGIADTTKVPEYGLDVQTHAANGTLRVWDSGTGGYTLLRVSPGSAQTSVDEAVVIETSVHVVGNLRIDGAISGSGALPNVGTPGTYTKVTVDSKGRVSVGAALAAGDIPDVSATYIKPSILPAFANNAAALLGGLVAGQPYRTGGDPDLVAVVH